MGLEKDLLGSLLKNHNMVLVYQPKGYPLVTPRMHRILSRNFGKICVVTARRPARELIGVLEGEKLDSSRYQLIDCSMAPDGGAEQKISPDDLDGLGAAIEKAARGGAELLVVDDVSSLLQENDDISVLKFLHRIMVSLRKTDMKSLYLISGEAKEYILADLELFSDSVIQTVSGRDGITRKRPAD